MIQDRAWIEYGRIRQERAVKRQFGDNGVSAVALSNLENCANKNSKENGHGKEYYQKGHRKFGAFA